jgi:hypothetical protein
MTESNGSAVNKVVGSKGDEEAALCLGDSRVGSGSELFSPFLSGKKLSFSTQTQVETLPINTNPLNHYFSHS